MKIIKIMVMRNIKIKVYFIQNIYINKNVIFGMFIDSYKL